MIIYFLFDNDLWMMMMVMMMMRGMCGLLVETWDKGSMRRNSFEAKKSFSTMKIPAVIASFPFFPNLLYTDPYSLKNSYEPKKSF